MRRIFFGGASLSLSISLSPSSLPPILILSSFIEAARQSEFPRREIVVGRIQNEAREPQLFRVQDLIHNESNEIPPPHPAGKCASDPDNGSRECECGCVNPALGRRQGRKRGRRDTPLMARSGGRSVAPYKGSRLLQTRLKALYE